ncbi:hypothetical protein GW17_00022993 [Ensete ventricosum]|nr:hypothetical protein GW17_00022993 [Ensete ventricosum]
MSFSFLFYPLCNRPSSCHGGAGAALHTALAGAQPAASALLDTCPAPADRNPGPDPEPRLGTYVVRVPKDPQVYRVPPPENAKLAERYRNQNKSRRRGSPCLKWILGVAFLVLLLNRGCHRHFLLRGKPWGSDVHSPASLRQESPQHHGSAPEAGV